jgi:hypothetical protein
MAQNMSPLNCFRTAPNRLLCSPTGWLPDRHLLHGIPGTVDTSTGPPQKYDAWISEPLNPTHIVMTYSPKACFGIIFSYRYYSLSSDIIPNIRIQSWWCGLFFSSFLSQPIVPRYHTFCQFSTLHPTSTWVTTRTLVSRLYSHVPHCREAAGVA